MPSSRGNVSEWHSRNGSGYAPNASGALRRSHALERATSSRESYQEGRLTSIAGNIRMTHPAFIASRDSERVGDNAAVIESFWNDAQAGAREAWAAVEESEEESAETSFGPRASSRRAPCRTPLHVVFVVDASKSMARVDVGTLPRIQAVLDVIKSALGELRGQPQGADDITSLVTFSDEAICIFSRIFLDDAVVKLSEMSRVKAFGPTKFRIGFEAVADLLNDHSAPEDDARVVFLSDGRPNEQAATMKHFAKLLNSPGVQMLRSFEVHTVCFGKQAVVFGDEYLKPMALQGNGTYQVSDLTVIALQVAFSSVTSSITATRSRSEGMQVTRIDKDRALRTPFDPTAWDDKSSNSCSRHTCKRLCRLYSLVAEKQKGELVTFSKHLKHSPDKGIWISVEQKAIASGAMRIMYRAIQDRQPPLAAKRLWSTEHGSECDMLPFCKSSALAIMFAKDFQEELSEIGPKGLGATILFAPCTLNEYKTECTESNIAFFVTEGLLEGEFIKYNSNSGFVNKDCDQIERLQAYSHYTYVRSKFRYMVADLQGVFDKKNQTFVLTDPQVLSFDQSFGFGDLGLDGFERFMTNHQCGRTCELLGLSDADAMATHIKEMQRTRVCTICQDAEISTMLVPCQHSLTCTDCANRLIKITPVRCPLCRKRVTDFKEGDYCETYVKPGGSKTKKKKAQKNEQAQKRIGRRVAFAVADPSMDL